MSTWTGTAAVTKTPDNVETHHNKNHSKILTRYSGMLSPRGQRGFKAKIFSLGLLSSRLGLGLVLMQCWPHSHKGCPRGLVVSHRNHVIYVTFFSDRKLLFAL